MSRSTSSTRRFLELNVGGTHTLQVVLYVRQKDRMFLDQYGAEVRHILSTRIVPREFENEMRAHHEKVNGASATVVTKAGEVNEKRPLPMVMAKPTGKRKRKGKAVEAAAAAAAAHLEAEEKPRRDVRHVFGDNVQLTYRLQDTQKNDDVTISVQQVGKGLTFRQFPRLSKRLVIWCFPKDQVDEDFPDGGFPRPELIPIADLFRSEEE